MTTIKIEKKDFAGEMASETATAKTKEVEAIYFDTERSQQFTEPSHWLIEIKNKMRHQYNKYLATTSSSVIPIILISVMITLVCMVPLIIEQNEKIAVIKAHLSHEIKATDGELQEDLTSVKENMTRLITTLQTELQHVKHTFEILKSNLEEIRENQEKLVQFVDHTSKVLNNTNTRLESVGDQLNDKVDMEDFEVHSMNLTSLAESYTQLHINLTQLTTDVDKLEGDIKQMDTSLHKKATQEEFNSLSRNFQILEESTVSFEEFKRLQCTVGKLDKNKADKNELRQVSVRVNDLESDHATKTDMNNIENKLNGHISSSDVTHDKLSDDVSSNRNDIQSNKNRLRQLETNSGSSRPTLSWTILGTTLSLALVFIYSSRY